MAKDFLDFYLHIMYLDYTYFEYTSHNFISNSIGSTDFILLEGEQNDIKIVFYNTNQIRDRRARSRFLNMFSVIV